MLAAFSHFFALFQASGGILAFFIKFLGFGIDFGWVGGGFGRGWDDLKKVFSMIFHVFVKNGNFVEIIVLLW